MCKAHQHYANLLESKHQNMEKGADLNNRRMEVGHQSWTGHVEDLKLSETMCIFWVPSIFAAKPSGEECTSLSVESNSKRLPMEVQHSPTFTHGVCLFLGFNTCKLPWPRSRDLVVPAIPAIFAFTPSQLPANPGSQQLQQLPCGTTATRRVHRVQGKAMALEDLQD